MVGDEVGERADAPVRDNEEVHHVHRRRRGQADAEFGCGAVAVDDLDHELDGYPLAGDQPRPEQSGLGSGQSDRRRVELSDRGASVDDAPEADQPGVEVEELGYRNIARAHACEVALDDGGCFGGHGVDASAGPCVVSVWYAEVFMVDTSGWLRHRTWFAVALSYELDGGSIHPAELFDERLVVYRDRSGSPVVLGARCPHMGADLGLGDVVGDDIRCTFHHFCFGPDGRCTSVPSGDRIPAAAHVPSFPAVERWGIVWAFNGDAPDGEPPGIRGYADADLAVRARRTDVFPVEPWVILGNSFDFQHLRFVHGLRFDDPDPIEWFDNGRVEYEVPFESDAIGAFAQRIRVSGTNTVSYVTTGSVDSMGMFTSTPCRVGAQSYYLAATPRDGGDEAIEARLAYQEAIADALLVDDTRAFAGMEFREGAFVAADRHLVRWFRHARTYPVFAQ